MEFLIFYLVMINLLAYMAFGIDKNKAIKGGWRIPESTLLLYSFVGGGIGSLIGMEVFKHKTLKFKFRFGVPFLSLLSIAVLYLVYNNFF